MLSLLLVSQAWRGQVHVSSTALPCVHVSSTALPCVHVSSNPLPRMHVSSTALPHMHVSSTALPRMHVSSTALPRVRVSSTALPCMRVSSTALPCMRVSSTALPRMHVSSTALPRVPTLLNAATSHAGRTPRPMQKGHAPRQQGRRHLRAGARWPSTPRAEPRGVQEQRARCGTSLRRAAASGAERWGKGRVWNLSESSELRG